MRRRRLNDGHDDKLCFDLSDERYLLSREKCARVLRARTTRMREMKHKSIPF